MRFWLNSRKRLRDLIRSDMWHQKRSKYGNIETMYDGTLYRSRSEAIYAKWLDSEKRLGRVTSWRYEIPIELNVQGGKKLWDYMCDFEVIFPGGRVELHEVKGKWTAIARAKVKHVKLQYNRIVKIIEARDLLTTPRRDYS